MTLTPSLDTLGHVSFEAAVPQDLPVAAIRDTVASHGLARIRGLFDRDALREVLAGMVAGFDASRDARHDPRDTDAVRRNFQKLQIGANSGVNSRRTLGRFMRVIYNPIFADDIYGLRPHFVTLARVRNLLFGRPIEFAIHGTDAGYWTCARIQQYPAGGGFMVPHRDMYAQAATSEAGLDYFQVILQLTEKGLDFEEGGAYVDVNDERVLYEHACLTGDVVVYDGRSVHGVADVDPMKALDLSRLDGRVVAFVSLFRLLRPGADDYARLGELARDQFGAGRPD
jgi:hypothetical protein